MTRRPVLLWTILLACSLAALGISARSALRARAGMQRELEGLRRTRSQLQEIALLRAAAPVWAAKAPPAAGLTPRISAALQSAGLPTTALASLSPENEIAAGGPPELGARRRRATLTLRGVTLPGVGALLAAWREREPDWTVTSVELAPDLGKAPPQGGDLPLRATVTLEAVYVEDGHGPASGGQR